MLKFLNFFDGKADPFEDRFFVTKRVGKWDIPTEMCVSYNSFGKQNWQSFKDGNNTLDPRSIVLGREIERILLEYRVARLEDLKSDQVDEACLAYICCYFSKKHFKKALKAIDNKGVSDHFVCVRGEIVDLARVYDAAQRARIAYYNRMNECRDTPIDITGDDQIVLLNQMSPDDWHDIVINWNWDFGSVLCHWVVSQSQCDRATAVYTLFAVDPLYVLQRRESGNPDVSGMDIYGLVDKIFANIKSNYYSKHDFSLNMNEKALKAAKRQLEEIARLGNPAWVLSSDILSRTGKTPHNPKYSSEDGQIQYHYDYWLKHIASPR